MSRRARFITSWISFLMVLIGVGTYAYRRDDGVLVVPLSTLRP